MIQFTSVKEIAEYDAAKQYPRSHKAFFHLAKLTEIQLKEAALQKAVQERNQKELDAAIEETLIEKGITLGGKTAMQITPSVSEGPFTFNYAVKERYGVSYYTAYDDENGFSERHFPSFSAKHDIFLNLE